ncbi:protein phosphatase 2C domain-containing protein [Streptomyces roseolilacinus]|uniref:protein phosphatase 2C domain-containing protein n=1 Tax=Streptomyces roseolilacinus TaxID=66904 RepID=UPI003825656A
MNPQGDRPAADDDWWERLYDDPDPDAAPAATGETLDDRYASASGALAPPPEPPPSEPPPSEPPPSAPPPGAPPSAPPPGAPPAAVPHPRATGGRPAGPRPPLTASYVGDGPPTYDPEPTALPPAGPGEPDGPVPDTVLDGARYGTFTLRAASTRGDSARFRGEPRRDALLTARFGAGEGLLVMVAVATGDRAGGEAARRAAGDACDWIGRAVGLSHERLARDIAAGRRDDLKAGLHRLTDRVYGRLRARAAERGADPGAYTAGLRCLLLSGAPGCRTRISFGAGEGGLFRLRDGVWQDLEPPLPEPAPSAAPPAPGPGSPRPPHDGDDGAGPDRTTLRLGVPQHPGAPFVEGPPPPAVPFRFRASVARPGDTLLLAGGGLAEPLRREPALARELAARWTSGDAPPGLATFLADTRLRVKGYADDRTAAAVWEA